jgi:iron(III) transport system substrate-binding protein
MFRASLLVFVLALIGEKDFVHSSTIDGAKQEGKIVWYSVVNESPDLAKEFEKKYPFIKVDVLRLSNPRLLVRILTETQAGRYGYDVVRANAFTINALMEKGLLSPYDSPERKAYSAGWKDARGFWTSTDENLLVIGYNTRLVSHAEAPKDWNDLLDPKWKGQIGMEPSDFELYAGLQKKWGAQRASAFFKELAKQDVQFRSGHTLLAQLVVAGETKLAVVFAHRVEAMKSQRAPIEWVSTMDPIISSLGVISLAAKPVNPNAARLLIDYILSKDGQRQLQRQNRVASRIDIDPLTPKLDRRKLALLPLEPELGKNMKEHVERFRSFFGIQG